MNIFSRLFSPLRAKALEGKLTTLENELNETVNLLREKKTALTGTQTQLRDVTRRAFAADELFKEVLKQTILTNVMKDKIRRYLAGDESFEIKNLEDRK